MTAPNAALAYRVLDHIDAHPEQHSQVVWIRRPAAAVGDCGTVACFAGWTALLAGDKPIFYDDDGGGETPDVEVGGGVQLVSYRAAELLGMPPDDGPVNVGGYRLFDGSNTREQLRELVAEIFGPRPAVTA